MMKNYLNLLLLTFSVALFAQKEMSSLKTSPSTTTLKNINSTPEVSKINDSVTALIPYKKDGNFGFINQRGKIVVPPIYSNVGFFTEDCNLLNSPNSKAKKFGTSDYASVRLNGKDYRINRLGRRVYYFKDEDLGKCQSEFRAQLFHAYIMNYAYGIIEDSKFKNPGDYRDFTIYPQYDYLHILEGDDLKNPMIVASRGNKFGIIDINNKVIVPFEYSDIKRNYSWKLARLFEVTKDGEHYYYIDINNTRY